MNEHQSLRPGETQSKSGGHINAPDGDANVDAHVLTCRNAHEHIHEHKQSYRSLNHLRSAGRSYIIIFHNRKQGENMKHYGFTATRSVIVKGYLDVENEAEAKKKILAGEYDDIIDESDNGGIENVVEIWEEN